MKTYEHLFFDLDHTLWDFDTNARETLLELFDTYKLSNHISSAEEFIENYTTNNHKLWKDYHNGIITKETLRNTRFKKTFTELGLPESAIPVAFEDDYVRICPTKINLFPNTKEVLEYLQDRYQLHIITNGFKESSDMKIKRSGLDIYFKHIFISESIGIYKPDTALFKHAINFAKTSEDKSIMIGDSLEADILGAKNAGIDQIFFNPNAHEHDVETTYEIQKLDQLIEIL